MPTLEVCNATIIRSGANVCNDGTSDRQCSLQEAGNSLLNQDSHDDNEKQDKQRGVT